MKKLNRIGKAVNKEYYEQRRDELIHQKNRELEKCTKDSDRIKSDLHRLMEEASLGIDMAQQEIYRTGDRIYQGLLPQGFEADRAEVGISVRRFQDMCDNEVENYRQQVRAVEQRRDDISFSYQKQLSNLDERYSCGEEE